MLQVNQHNASRFGELRIGPEHVDREGDFVDDALAGRLLGRPQFEIGRVGVVPIAVSMVDVFALDQRATKHFLHDDAVLVQLHTAAFMKSTVAGRNEISVLGYRTPFAAKIAAFLRAKLGRVVMTKLFPVSHAKAATGNDLSAMSALECGRFLDAALATALPRAKTLARVVFARLKFLAALCANFRRHCSRSWQFVNHVQFDIFCPVVGNYFAVGG